MIFHVCVLATFVAFGFYRCSLAYGQIIDGRLMTNTLKVVDVKIYLEYLAVSSHELKMCGVRSGEIAETIVSGNGIATLRENAVTITETLT